MDAWVWKFCINNRRLYKEIQELKAMAAKERGDHDRGMGEMARQLLVEAQRRLDEKEARACAAAQEPMPVRKKAKRHEFDFLND
jgi:hypothetical protein